MNLAPGTLFAGDFRIVAPLGEGGMGAVYVAEQISTGARRALKLMQQDLVRSAAMREKFEQEARIGARIESDHVAQVVAAGVDAATGLPWIAMELLKGETLEAYAARRGPLSLAEVEAIFGQLVHALGAAHRQGIVHRDLKPENVFLATPRVVGMDYMVKVLDFGIAKVVAEASVTQTGVLGTPAFMAPEQYQGRGIGPWTDVWALGLIAFQLLTGRSYWRGAQASDTGASLMYEACMGDLPPASVRAAELGVAAPLPPGFDAWFARAAARDPQARFPNADQALAALRSLAAGPQFEPKGNTEAVRPAPPPTPLVPQYVPPRAAPSSSAGLVVGLLVGAMVIVALMGAGALVAMRHLRGTSSEIEGEESGAAWSDDDSPVPVSSRDPSWGSRAAPVTIVVFSDFQCPFCGKLRGTLVTLRETYGREKLRIVWKNHPLAFHKDARPAAIAGEAVFRLGGSDAFWKFHDRAFANQRALDADSFETWAVAAGVDRAKFRAEIGAPGTIAKVEADEALAKRAGVTGTPASFVNGILVSGAQPLEKFTAVIDEQLEAARAAVAAGTRPERVYAKLSTENKAKAPPPPAPAEEDDGKVWKVPVGSSPALGRADAPVTIVEFADFQCPFCARAEATLQEVMRSYGGKVRLVWKHNPLPFHPRAEPCAHFALEARAQRGDAGFWAAHDAIFKDQSHLTDEDLAARALSLGLDARRVKAAVASRKYAAEIAADRRLADEVKATGTPHFFINGHRLVGAQPIEKFRAIIDKELAHGGAPVHP